MQSTYIPKILREIKALFILAMSSLVFLACRRLVDVTPPATAITGNNVYTSNATAAAVLTGIYSNMSGGSFATGASSISLLCGLSADEWQLTGNTGSNIYPLFYANALNSTNIPFWGELYNYIYKTNAALEGISNSSGLTPSVKQQLLGEGKFMRAFFYFYLVNLFGDVPLAITSNYETNATISRTPKIQVYQQIIKDLKDAKILLNSNYVAGDAITMTAERVRPCKGAAGALLARVYLYLNNWVEAEEEADSIINNTTYSLTPNLNDAFLKNSSEAIWQIQPISTTINTFDGNTYILNSVPNGSNPVYLSTTLLNEFEPNDNRRISWIHDTTISGQIYSYPFKYKIKTSTNLTEYLMVFRLTEEYLIRAEARAYQNNLIESQLDFNTVRKRAGLPNTTANSQSQLLTAIQHERQVEFFSEWGHRWLDLKRTDLVNSVMNVATPQKGGTWNENWQWYPIPLNSLQNDPNLTQNAGY